jgi:hypothetical protein
MSKHTIEVEVDRRLSDVPMNDNLSPVTEAMANLAKVPIDAIGKVVNEMVDQISEAVRPKVDGPESCTVKFGFKVTGSGNVILAKMGSELNLEVTIVWKR